MADLPSLPAPWYTYGAWRLLSELARRHPGSMHVIEGEYPAGGTVWFLVEPLARIQGSIVSSKNFARLNERGHVDIFHQHAEGECPVEEGLQPDDDPRLWTVEPVFSPKFRDIVADVERCLGWSSPPHTPATVSSSVGWMLIAAALGMSLHSARPLSVSGVLYDGVHPRVDIIRRFLDLSPLEQGILQPATATQDPVIGHDALKKLASLFVVSQAPRRRGASDEFSEPLVVVDIVSGQAYFPGGTVDLMSEYQAHHRDIHDLAWSVVSRGRAAIS